MNNTHRIAAFGLCDPGYSEDAARRQHEAAVAELRKTFADIADAGLQTDEFMPFVRAARARRMLSGSRIGMAGFGDMQLQNTGFDVQEVHERPGVEVLLIDMLQILQDMEKISGQ